MPQPNQLRILIIAENASSRFGGEAFLPLKYFEILKRRGYDATLLTHERNKDDLDQFLADHVADIQYVPDTIWHRLICRICDPMPAKIGDVIGEMLLKLAGARAQSRSIKKMIAEGKVNLIHQPTPVSPRSPSALHRFGLPLIIGPMNGGMTYPEGYEDFEPSLTRQFVRLGRSFAFAVNWLIPGKRRAVALIVANARTQAALPVRNHGNIIELVENGVDMATWQAPSSRPPRAGSDVFRLVFMGRLVDWKAVDITLRALHLARMSGLDIRLDILGDGSARTTLETLSEELGLGEVVTFHGFLPQAQCVDHLARSDTLILNSIFECGGAVVLEAMSLGLPVIAADWGGPADYLDESCGILVPPAPRDTFERRLSDAIIRLAGDPDLCRAQGQAGAAKIRDIYDWELKVDRMIEIYNAALSEDQR